MKQTILVAIMIALVTTPCLAQEIEPEEMFSIEGTRWVYCELELGIFCGILGCLPGFNVGCDDMAFYEGDVYRCNNDSSQCGIDSDLAYIDSPLVSIVYTRTNTSYLELRILQPIGFGVYTGFGMKGGDYGYGGRYVVTIGIMFKVDNNWSPPEEE